MLTQLGIGNSPVIRRARHAEAEGLIYRQSPHAGAPVGGADEIVLNVSDGPPDPPPPPGLVTVPQVEGLQQAEAIASIERAGLVAAPDAAFEESSLGSEQVVRTDPGAGAQVPRGSPIRLILSLGPPVPPESELDRLLSDPLRLLFWLLTAIAVALLCRR